MVNEAGVGRDALAQPGVGRIVRGEGGGIKIVNVGKKERRELLEESKQRPASSSVSEPSDDTATIDAVQSLREETAFANLEGPASSEIPVATEFKGYAGRQPTWDEILINGILNKFPLLKRLVPEKEERIE